MRKSRYQKGSVKKQRGRWVAMTVWRPSQARPAALFCGQR